MLMKRRDIYMVDLEPTKGHEQRGHRPVLVIVGSIQSAHPMPRDPPITNGGGFVRRVGFAVPISGIKTTGVIRCDQPRTLDLEARNGRKVDDLPVEIVDEVLAIVVQFSSRQRTQGRVPQPFNSHPHRRLLLRRLDHHHREEPRHIRLVAKQPVAEIGKLFHVLQPQHQHDIAFAGHGIGLRHGLLAAGKVEEAAHVFLAMQFQLDRDDGLDPAPGLGRIEDGDDAVDDAGGAEPLDAAQAAGGRQADLVGHVDIGARGIALHQVQEFAVDPVHGRMIERRHRFAIKLHKAAIFDQKCERLPATWAASETEPRNAGHGRHHPEGEGNAGDLLGAREDHGANRDHHGSPLASRRHQGRRPGLCPVMHLVGLPPELGLAWLTAMLVGIWGAVPLIFTLVPVSSLSVADVTIFSALILFAHGLPIEQKIIEKAGPGVLATTLLRIGGGLLYAFLLHHILTATGWMSAPVNPAWIPIAATPDWTSYLWGLGETMVWMLVILFALTIGLDLLKVSGILSLMMKLLSPLLRLAGIRGEAGHLTAVGLFLGISYGGGLLIREAQSGLVSPRRSFWLAPSWALPIASSRTR